MDFHAFGKKQNSLHFLKKTISLKSARLSFDKRKVLKDFVLFENEISMF